MLTRRQFLGSLVTLPLAASLARAQTNTEIPPEKFSAFSKRLRPIGRILELEGCYVWCNAPVDGPDGRTHLFFSRWPASLRMSGWINASEIAHAVADVPEGPYTVLGTVLAPREPGHWDATTCHNPHIRKIGDRYALFYMGNSNGKTDTKRIGVALADSLDGPWQRSDAPLLEPGPTGAWDDHCTTNPSLIQHPSGEFWLYYKSWNTAEYDHGQPPVRGNRKYGLAVADRLQGPYHRHPRNPLIDFSGRGRNRQCEDAFVWLEDGRFKIIVRDMGVFNHEVGLIMESDDGLAWSEPLIAYQPVRAYVDQPPAPRHLTKYGRFERPQLLLRNGHPAYLFTTTQGGRYETATPFLFKIV
jgi:beta-xylosidase